jgi:hypothetical protein
MPADLEIALRRELRAWSGLSEELKIDTVLEALAPLERIHQAEERPREAQRFQLLVVDRPAPPRRVEVWTRHGERHVALVECDDPAVPDLERLLEAYGPPEFVQDGRRFAEGAVVREWIYPSRGISLSVAELVYAGPGPGPRRRLIHLQLYQAMTVQAYVSDIGPGPMLRPAPRSSP